MALRDFHLPTKTIELPGGAKVTVRGLTFHDLTKALARYRDDLKEIYDTVSDVLSMSVAAGAAGDPSLVEMAEPGDRVSSAALAALEKAPEAVSYLVALAANEEGNLEEAMGAFRSMPLVPQLEIMLAVVELTFVSEAAVGNLLTALANAMDGFAETIQQARALPTGSMESAARSH